MARLGKIWRWAMMAAATATLAACASAPRDRLATPELGAPGSSKVGKPYQIKGRWYVPREDPHYDKVGIASWYGDAFHLRPTANGETFDMTAVTAAHTTLPLPSIVEVTNLDNGRRLMVRVNDRGPFVDDRIIDISREGARELGFDRAGLARVRVRYVGPAPLLGRDAGVRMARAKQPPPARPVQMASAPPPPPRITPPPAVAFVSAPAPVQVATLPAMPVPVAAPAAIFRIQAGAFSAEANAQRAVSQLATVGQAVIEPTDRGGVTLYRVMVQGPEDELQAFGLRERVAEAGFRDAMVVRPF